MDRAKPWVPAAILGVLGLLAFWGAGMVLMELHEDMGELLAVDAALMEWVRRHTAPAWAPFLFFLTELLAGRHWPLQAAFSAGVLLLLWARGFRCEAAGALSTLLLACAGVWLAKLSFQRLRPDVAWALATETSFSFPSGHSAFAVVFYGLGAYLVLRITRRPALGALAAAAALFLIAATGYSRVYLGVHYPSDVFAGFAVGAIWTAAGITAAEALRLATRRERLERLRHAAVTARDYALHSAARLRDRVPLHLRKRERGMRRRSGTG